MALACLTSSMIGPNWKQVNSAGRWVNGSVGEPLLRRGEANEI